MMHVVCPRAILAVIVPLMVFSCARPRPAPEAVTQHVLGRGAELEPPCPSDHIAFSDRALIVRDPAVLEAIGYDPSPTPLGKTGNPASLKTLWELAGAKNFDAATAEWKLPDVPLNIIVNGWPACPDGHECLDRAPFRLLAIAFRPDLAEFRCGAATEGSDACGAEIHFEFGQIDAAGAPVKAAAIAEFAVPRQSKAEFQAMLRDWTGLAAIDNSAALAKAVAEKWARYQPSFSIGRVRLSANLLSVWIMQQYSFDNAGRLVVAAALPGEIDPLKWNGGDPKKCQLTPDATTFMKTYTGGVVPNQFLRQAAMAGVRTPIEVGAGYSRDVRFGLAQNTCSGCHFQETGTFVVHIKGRRRGEKSALSAFLTGNGASGDASYGEPTCGYHVQKDQGTCYSDAAPNREFNDLLRRRLYLDTALALNPSDTNWSETLRQKSLSITAIH
ncbi:MAG: hypothetical protein ABI693_18525 [Bryobacteraceae bacterium]